MSFQDVLYIWTTADAVLELVGSSWLSLIALDGSLAECKGPVT